MKAGNKRKWRDLGERGRKTENMLKREDCVSVCVGVCACVGWEGAGRQ